MHVIIEMKNGEVSQVNCSDPNASVQFFYHDAMKEIVKSHRKVALKLLETSKKAAVHVVYKKG